MFFSFLSIRIFSAVSTLGLSILLLWGGNSVFANPLERPSPVLNSNQVNPKAGTNGTIHMVQGAPEGYRVYLHALCPTGDKLIYGFANSVIKKGSVGYEYTISERKTRLIYKEPPRGTPWYDAVYSDDCNYVAFTSYSKKLPRSNPKDSLRAYVMNLSTKKIVQIAATDPSSTPSDFPASLSIVRFNPQNNNVLVETNQAAVLPNRTNRIPLSYHYLIYDPVSGDGRQIAEFRFSLWPIKVSLDDRYLYMYKRSISASEYSKNPIGRFFDDNENETLVLYDNFTGFIRVDRITGETKQLTVPPEEPKIAYFLRSSSSTDVYYVKVIYGDKLKEYVFYLADFENNSSVEIARYLETTRAYRLSTEQLTADNKRLVFNSSYQRYQKRDQKDTSDLFSLDVDTGKIEIISKPYTGIPEPDHHVYDFQASRDGKVIAFESLQSNLVKGDKTKVDLFVYDSRQ